MQVATRRDLAGYLEDRMAKSYVELRDAQQLKPESSLVKTYMIEAHVGGTGSHDDLMRLLRDAVASACQAGAKRAEVLETDEERFVLLDVQARLGATRLYVDASDARFWLAHSMDHSTAVDWVVDRLTSVTPDLDTAWLPVALLEEMAQKGSFRGLGLDYDRRPFLDCDDDDAEGVSYFKMQLWGNRAHDVLARLRQDGAFPHETTLAKVKVKSWLDGHDGAFTVDDVKFNGKVTARGTSFQCHNNLVTDLYRRYAAMIGAIEAVGRVRWEYDDSRARLRGTPVHLHIPKHGLDPADLCARLFTCGSPFRLWGLPVPISPDYYRVCAVDLHVGHALDFEVSPEWVRVYLGPETCGNTVVRLLTNLQHSLDARTEARIHGRSISELQPADGEPLHRHV